MKTSQQWWDEVKSSPELLEDWLVKQHRGEVTAAVRIYRFANQFSSKDKETKILEIIAEQERQHALWIFDLLQSRGINPPAFSIEHAENRYWKETLPGITDFYSGCAVAAHAEKMRLERIKVISNDETAPYDIVSTFKKILKDELFHEKAFREMSTQEDLDRTKDNHEAGLNALGLTI